MENAIIGDILRKMRERCGLTAKDVSVLLKSKYSIDMNHRTLFNYEKGRSTPDVEKFLALCSIYKCNNPLNEFGYSIAHDTGFDFEEIVLFEDEYSPDNWQMIKSFIALIPRKDSQ